MKKDKALQLNANKRIFQQKNILCGCLITGSDKQRSGFGNGDCLMFDLENNVFAVADGSERFPWASREVLVRLRDFLKSGRPENFEEWKILFNRVYEKQKFHHKTTFSCIAINRNDDGVSAVISNGGDSSVTLYDKGSDEIIFQTKSNMDFAGRSKGIVDVSEQKLKDKNFRIIISTDGMNDLVKFCKKEKINDIKNLFMADPVQVTCEIICGIFQDHNEKFEYDDTGFIAIDPLNISDNLKVKVIIGGTKPHDESFFLNKIKDSSNSEWLDYSEWSENLNLLTQSGIIV